MWLGLVTFASPINNVLRDFIIDGQQVLSPWSMYWNRLALYMAYHLERGMHLIPGWLESQQRVRDMAHVLANYLFTASLLRLYGLLELRIRLVETRPTGSTI